MFKRYGILAAAVALLGALAAVRLWPADPPPAPTPPPARPAVEPTPPTRTTSTTPPPPKPDPTVRATPPAPKALRFEPTERLSELLALEELLRPEIIEGLSRHIEKEGESLAAEGLLVPLQGLFDLLVAGRPLRDAVAWLIGQHQRAGRDALARHLDHLDNRLRARTLTEDDQVKIKRDQERLNLHQELRTELERSLVTP